MITSVDEYTGEAAIRIRATQLGDEVFASRARKIVDEWCAFFASGSSPIEDLEFVSRTPARLFESLRGQTELTRLNIKWGDYEDLTALQGMYRIEALALRGASSVRDITPLGDLVTLRDLQIEEIKHAHDVSALSSLVDLRALDLGGNWMSPRIAHIDSIDFIAGMTKLDRLILHSIIVDSLDYSPLLRHPDLREARVMKARGMNPTHDALCSTIRNLEPAS